MVPKVEKLGRSIQACIENAKRLLEDAEWSTSRASTGLALAMLAQEECGKAFVLALVRDEILPWTEDVRRSLSIHECKNLVMVIMEWLCTVNEVRLNEALGHAGSNQNALPVPQHLPPDVATAMNIYRHEMIERIGRRSPERFPEWRGRARRVAEGHRDRKKQDALYVGIGEDGGVSSLPPTSVEAFNAEFARAETLIKFAEDVSRKCIFANREYELIAETFKAMFQEGSASPEEVVPSGIPGVEFVRRTITVANVVSPASDERDEPRND